MDMKACDKMILAIIQDDSYQDVISELNESGFYATILHSSGGFLKKQSVTIMIGLNHEDLEKALKILKRTLKSARPAAVPMWILSSVLQATW